MVGTRVSSYHIRDRLRVLYHGGQDSIGTAGYMGVAFFERPRSATGDTMARGRRKMVRLFDRLWQTCVQTLSRRSYAQDHEIDNLEQ